MGYETSFRLKGELDNQFKSSFNVEKGDINMYKTLLKAYCMDKNNSDKDNWMKLYKSIQFNFRCYMNLLTQDWKRCIEDRLKSEEYGKYGMWFCGWNFARHATSFNWNSEEDIEEFFVNSLFELAICDAGSRFDEGSNYYTKLEDINNQLSELADIVDDFWDHKFVDFYREHPELADEDGDDTPIERDNEDDEDNDDDVDTIVKKYDEDDDIIPGEMHYEYDADTSGEKHNEDEGEEKPETE